MLQPVSPTTDMYHQSQTRQLTHGARGVRRTRIYDAPIITKDTDTPPPPPLSVITTTTHRVLLSLLIPNLQRQLHELVHVHYLFLGIDLWQVHQDCTQTGNKEASGPGIGDHLRRTQRHTVQAVSEFSTTPVV